MNIRSNLLTGPVRISAAAQQALKNPAVSHRDKFFVQQFMLLKQKLCYLVHVADVEIFTGSGTLANDVVAAHLSELNSKGLILSNGEFGERLISQASQQKLDFISYSTSWGKEFDYAMIEQLIRQNKTLDWIWLVHSETSTGVLNHLNRLRQLANQYQLKLCLDCISSIGVIDLDLSAVYLATASSGKGLCSFSGLAMVFYNQPITSGKNIPKYLDLAYYRESNGIPFTISSNLTYALLAAVQEIDCTPANNAQIGVYSDQIRHIFTACGFKIINAGSGISAAVVTAQLTDNLSSQLLGEFLAKHCCLLGYSSQYLLKRNWIQTYVTRQTYAEEIKYLHTLLEQYLTN